MMTAFHVGVPVGQPVSQHAQCQSPGTQIVEQNAAIIVISHTCVHCEKHLPGDTGQLS